MTSQTTISPTPGTNADSDTRAPDRVIVQMYLMGADALDILAASPAPPAIEAEYQPHRYTTSRHLRALRIAERESAAKFSLSVLGYLGNLSALLIVKKQLPSFYFKQTAQEIHAPRHVFRYAKATLWQPDLELWLARLKREREQRRHHVLEVMVRIYLKIIATPKDETFPEAMERLRSRIVELHDGTPTRKGISYNQMSQHIRIPYRPISHIAREGRDFNGTYCPWALLDKLQDAEQEIGASVHQRTIQNGVTRNDSGARDPKLPSLPGTTNQFILPGQNCMKCDAPWSHMYEDGQDAWGNHVYTCRTCGKNNPVAPPSQEYDKLDIPNPSMYIEKYGRCWNCQAPWHNFTRDGDDPWGNPLYVCVLCSQVNIVATTQKAPAA